MENVTHASKEYIRKRLYPFTLKHVIYVVVFTVLTTIVSEYVFRFRLLKWIYAGTMAVLAINVYKQGDNKKAVGDIFKLATV